MHGRCGGSEENISDFIAESSRFRETAQRTSGLREGGKLQRIHDG
jgi:hypothetical protein